MVGGGAGRGLGSGENQVCVISGEVCDPFAIRFLVYDCFSRTSVPSVALHVVEFTFSGGFESLPLRHYLCNIALASR
jgi:hypothetical protein